MSQNVVPRLPLPKVFIHQALCLFVPPQMQPQIQSQDLVGRPNPHIQPPAPAPPPEMTQLSKSLQQMSLAHTTDIFRNDFETWGIRGGQNRSTGMDHTDLESHSSRPMLTLCCYTLICNVSIKSEPASYSPANSDHLHLHLETDDRQRHIRLPDANSLM